MAKKIQSISRVSFIILFIKINKNLISRVWEVLQIYHVLFAAASLFPSASFLKGIPAKISKKPFTQLRAQVQHILSHLDASEFSQGEISQISFRESLSLHLLSLFLLFLHATKWPKALFFCFMQYTPPQFFEMW